MSERWASLGLTIFLLLVIGAMTWMALDFNAQARRVPLAVGIPTVVLLVVQLGREALGFKLGAEVSDAKAADDEQASPAVAGVEPPATAHGGLFKTPDVRRIAAGQAGDGRPRAGVLNKPHGATSVAEPSRESPAEAAADPAARSRTERVEIAEPKASPAQAFGWIVLLGVCFYTLGMLATVPVFLLAFMRLYGRESWKTTALVIALTAGVLHFFFVVFLEVRLYGGLLGEWLDL